jgi:hypothetical protein
MICCDEKRIQDINKMICCDEKRIQDINKKIQNEICHDVIHQLKDENLIHEYKNCSSVKKKIQKLESVLKCHHIDTETIHKIINDYLLELIPAGTKGNIRGHTFNKIVKNHIMSLQLDSCRFEICFEKKHSFYMTNEIPDWYIFEKTTQKIIIGMNQLDLWNGGQQVNRGSYYLQNQKNDDEKYKLLCVICNDIQFKNKKKKLFKLFETGFEKNTLCYLKNIHSIIHSFFDKEFKK